MQKRSFFVYLLILFFFASCTQKQKKHNLPKMADPIVNFSEKYRPQFHFSPQTMWMNDPNGLVYNNGTYHLFYQYYPDDIIWGPMHWGHATSKDMLHWEHKKIALYPDKLGYIFSGSAVIDKNNTSELGSIENPPMVAIYTYHDPEGEKAERTDFQTQGIAYSTDNGETWIKYKDNPVIKNEGIKDFRDPKVFWHEASKKWILLLVAGDHAKIYASDNLKSWSYLSDFGKDQGAHGGVWECPDLFQLNVEGTDEKKWVLLISINPGAPNGGSGTQYFIGDFDGKQFTSTQKEHKWIDYGTDNYAGITYNNTPNNERIFIGWMSNWNYARDTPTKTWRSAMTLPRKLSLSKINGDYFLKNSPLEQLDSLLTKKDIFTAEIKKNKSFSNENFNASQIEFSTTQNDFQLVFSNKEGDSLSLEMNGKNNSFSIDRRQSGLVDFEEHFASKVHTMPVESLPKDKSYKVRLILDASSIEVFINDGQYVMTDQIFPTSNYTSLLVTNTSTKTLNLSNFEISNIKSIW